MGTGPTLVTNATKHNTPMANVTRLNTLLISAPVPFPRRCGRRLHSLTRRVATTLFLRQEQYAVGGGRRRREGGEAYSAAIIFDFKSMPSAFATPAP